MRRNSVVALKGRLEDAFALSVRLKKDEQLASHYARYLCVLTSGFLEEAVTTLLEAYAETRSHPRVQAYTSRNLYWFQNPKFGEIANLLGHFDSDWKVAFESLGDQARDAVNSVVGLRHKIAHGTPVVTSLNAIEEYKKTIVEVVDRLATIIGP